MGPGFRPGAVFLARCCRSGDAVLLEPGEHARPGVFGICSVVARPVVGVEAVLGIRIDLALADFARRFAGCLPLLDNLLRDELILAGIESEDRAFQIGGEVGWVFW